MEQINEDTGSDITWVTVPASGAWEKRNVMLASGDYPEVVMMDPPNDNIYDDMREAGRVVAVTDYLANAPNLMEYTHEVAWKALREDDGEIYLIPRCTIIREDFFYNRLDWREELGFDELLTPEDWIEYAAAVASSDPDGNGANDTFGVTDLADLMSATRDAGIHEFSKAWHASLDWYDDGSGNLFMGMFHRDGRFKNVLQFYRDLYETGGLDPDFISNRGTAQDDKWESGVSATVTTFAGALDSDLQRMRQIHPGAEIERVLLPEVGLSAAMMREKPVLTQTGIYNAWAITDKGAENAAHIVSVLDYLLSDTGWSLLRDGVEGVHYEIEGDERVRIEPAFTEFSKWRNWVMMFRRPNDNNFWLKGLVPELTDRQEQWLEESVARVENEYIQEGLAGFVPSAQREFEKTDIWTTGLRQISLEIIVGNRPVSDWDAFLDSVYDAGWQDVVDEYNAYYAENR